jgi:hypothetical protein
MNQLRQAATTTVVEDIRETRAEAILRQLLNDAALRTQVEAALAYSTEDSSGTAFSAGSSSTPIGQRLAGLVMLIDDGLDDDLDSAYLFANAIPETVPVAWFEGLARKTAREDPDFEMYWPEPPGG